MKSFDDRAPPQYLIEKNCLRASRYKSLIMNNLNQFFTTFKNITIMTKTLWLLACFGIVSASSCDKKTVEPVFQNSFSCKINGQLWEPNGPDGFFGFQKTLSFYFAPGETGLGIQADNKKDDQTITISCFCDAKIGIYKMKHLTPFLDFKNSCSYVIDTVKLRTITITSIDTTERMLTGIFEFTVFTTTKDCKQTVRDTLKFTDGKFSLKL